ncbi:hypothetical protein T11_13819 [Trichinella zimbabwensis]|uniref:Uncharacterized protein n=1 Tax=Trichinella zimbabwensis TaxID=268475 RepID=A0A0V1GBB0_9BILA|nr:hypothetical protein T11_13819 [Trichinella zimbabwensis]
MLLEWRNLIKKLHFFWAASGSLSILTFLNEY